jgi:HEAT repeat protein
VEALGNLHDSRAIAHLEKLLQSRAANYQSDLFVPEDSLIPTSLGRIGGPSALPGLLEALHDHEEMVRGAAARQLSCFSHPAIVPAIIKAFRNTHFSSFESPSVLRNYAVAIEHFKIRELVPDLIRLTRFSGNIGEQFQPIAALCLSHLGDPRAIPAFKEALYHDTVRYSLSNWTTLAATSLIKDFHQYDIAPFVLNMALLDETRRGELINLLVQTNDESIVALMRSALLRNTNELNTTRDFLAAALVMGGHADGLPVLAVALLRSSNDEEREFFWQALRTGKKSAKNVNN